MTASDRVKVLTARFEGTALSRACAWESMAWRARDYARAGSTVAQKVSHILRHLFTDAPDMHIVSRLSLSLSLSLSFSLSRFSLSLSVSLYLITLAA